MQNSQAAPTYYFGNNAIGTITDQNDPNAQSISFFTCATTGQVTDVIAYIAGASQGNAIAAIYAVNGNAPTTLLKQSNPASISTSFSWVDFQLPTPYTPTSGTTYGLAIMGNVPVNIRIVSGTGQRTGGPGYGSYAKGFTNPFGTIWFNDYSGAMSIYAAGTGSTPTATPTPTPDPTGTPTPKSTVKPANPSSSTNLAPIPDAWGSYSELGSVNYGTGVQITHLDTSVTFNGQPSIRIDAHTSADMNTYRECDSNCLSIKPGDHVTISIWIKTGGTHSDANYAHETGGVYGARIGGDFYADGQQVDGFTSSGGPNNAFSMVPYTPNGPNWVSTKGTASGTNVMFVPWGSDWTQQTWDFIVPSQYYTQDQMTGQSIPPSQISGVILWLDARETTYPYPVWFADAQVHISA